MITREQVADLQPGDIVEVSFSDGYTVRGPVVEKYGCLELGPHGVLRFEDGNVPTRARYRTLAVVSRAPRPLYVNHPRTEPVAGDICRSADDEDDRRTWMFRARTDAPPWTTHVSYDGPSNVIETNQRRQHLPARLRLLVDGETGQVVP